MKTATYTLDGFTRYNRKTHANETVSYTFSPTATGTYKWGVFAGDSTGAFKLCAFARSQAQAHEFAIRHGLKMFGYIVGKVNRYAPIAKAAA